MKKINEKFELSDGDNHVKKNIKNRIGWENLSSPGVYLAVPILAGLALGLWLDSAQGTKPLYTLVFLIAGTVSSMYNLSKLIRKS